MEQKFNKKAKSSQIHPDRNHPFPFHEQCRKDPWHSFFHIISQDLALFVEKKAGSVLHIKKNKEAEQKAHSSEWPTPQKYIILLAQFTGTYLRICTQTCQFVWLLLVLKYWTLHEQKVLQTLPQPTQQLCNGGVGCFCFSGKLLMKDNNSDRLLALT